MPHTYVIAFETAAAATDAKNTLRRAGIHAYCSKSEHFDRYPGREAYRAAHRNVTVVDHYSTEDSLAPALERRLDCRLRVT